MKFSGKNVLVTGASKGIGATTAYVLASYGLKVWINYNRSEESAKELKCKIENEIIDSDVELIQFDASNETEVVNAFKRIHLKDKTLSYLVNNAGITNDGFTITMALSDFKDVVDTNVDSCFLASKEALRIMSREKFGSIVNISSIAGETGNLGQVNYSASKGAIIAMTKTLAQEGARRKIRFNTITPGLIHTEMTSKIPQQDIERFNSNIPLNEFGEAEDIAYSVAFLLSDYAKYITGETLKVNGGLYM